MTCASSSFSPLARVVATTGILLADEGLDVGVEDFGVVALDLDAPAVHKDKILCCFFFSITGLCVYVFLCIKLTCSRGAGSMVRLLWQVEDLLTWIRWGNGILTLPSCNWVVLFTIIIRIEEFLKPLDEIKIVLKSALNQFLHRNNLNKKGENRNG